MAKAHAVALVGLLAVGLAFRVAIASSFSTSSPDGDQYYALSQSLLRDGRYAYAPPPAPLTYTRLPGYPFLTAALDGKPRGHEAHVQRAAYANALLDVLTALLLVLLVLSVDGVFAAGLAIIGVVLCPVIVLHSVHALSESLATFLGVLELFLLVGLSQGKRGYWLWAGLVAGLAQLVRFDAILLLPVVLLAAFFAPGSARRRAGIGALVLSTALVVFSPWPIRNLIRFGHAYPQATEWLAQNGQPLPTGIIRWMRTWTASAPGESYLSDLIVFGHPFSAKEPGVILPQMYDSPSERQALTALVERVGHGGLDAAADAEFVRLADERTARRPLRTYLWLPLARLPLLLSPPPLRTIRWIHLRLLDWPRSYGQFWWFYLLTYLFAPIGTAFLIAAGRLRVVALLWIAVGARVVLYSFAVPHQVGARYFVEAFPILILFASVGVTRSVRLAWQIARRLRTRLGSRSAAIGSAIDTRPAGP